MRWGKCEFSRLKKLSGQLDRLAQSDLDALCRSAAAELAGQLLGKVKKRTPVVYGALRNAWAVLPVERSGSVYTATVLNNLAYVSYVEYGHRQRPGRFIPGRWEGDRFVYDPKAEGGMVLKKAWVPGRHMLTISEQEVERLALKLVERRLYRLLKESFDA